MDTSYINQCINFIAKDKVFFTELAHCLKIIDKFKKPALKNALKF